MTISTNWQPRPMSSNLGLTYNLQRQINEQNAKTGSHIDLDKQIAATNATMILNIMV